MKEVFRSSTSLELAGALQACLHDVELRDFSLDIQQETALEEIGRNLVDGQKSGYVEMATGTGKTTIEALVAEAAVKAGKRVLILAPKISIARQISGRNQANPTGLTKFTDLYDSIPIGHHFGGQHATRDNRVVIATYQGFLNDVRNEHRIGEFDVIIADECHRSLGQHTAKAVSDSFPDAIKLGFSATPDYAIDRKSEEVFDNKIFEFSLIDAIESGKTAPLRTLVYETNVTLSLNDNRSEFTERELAPLIDNIERNGTAYQLAHDFVKDGRQGIIACIPGASNIHARVMANMLSANGELLAVDVGAHLSDEENAFRLKAFQEGDVQVLTFTRAIEEGWDSGRASFCINMAPTASPVRTKQLMGRVLRKNSDGRESLYVDFIDTKEGVAKRQYTAVHALELETIDFNRVLGHSSGDGKWRTPSSLELPIISDQLLQRIVRSQGRLIDDIGTNPKEKANPLFLHWERILEKEGMPAELDYNDVLPHSLNLRIKSAHAAFVAQHEREPVADELIDLLGSIDRTREHAMGYYGLRIAMEELDSNGLIADEEYDPYTQLVQKVGEDMVYQGLFSLNERSANILVDRFGLDDGEPRTYRQVGEIHGIGAQRVLQITSKALSQFRSRSTETSRNLKNYFVHDGWQPKWIDEAEGWIYRFESKLDKNHLERVRHRYKSNVNKLKAELGYYNKYAGSIRQSREEYLQSALRINTSRDEVGIVTKLSHLLYMRDRLLVDLYAKPILDGPLFLSVFDRQIAETKLLIEKMRLLTKDHRRGI